MRALSATITAVAMLGIATAEAVAQAPPGQDMPIATRSVKLTAEQHHVIKEIVIKDLKVKSVAGDVKVEVGEPVAADVSLHSFPPVIAEKIPEVRSHSFFVKGDQVIIVDPRDKKVADVIK